MLEPRRSKFKVVKVNATPQPPSWGGRNLHSESPATHFVATFSSRVPGRLERIERLLEQLHQKIDNFLRLRGTLGGGPETKRHHKGRGGQERVPDP